MGIRTWLRQATSTQRFPEPPSTWVPPGHFYSPLPSPRDISRDEERIFRSPPELSDVDVRPSEQLSMLATLAEYYSDIPFPELKSERWRYYYQNPAYEYGDAILLHTMLRHLRPRRLIEVGSGWSSCVILDTNAAFLADSMECTFIEPYPATLLRLAGKDGLGKAQLLSQRVQDVDVSVFRELEAGDVLFIDSTHVAKLGSDVSHLFTEVLPILRTGVYVHFHDLFYPFEYPRDWAYRMRDAHGTRPACCEASCSSTTRMKSSSGTTTYGNTKGRGCSR